MRNVEDNKLEGLVDYLLGTCQSLDSGLNTILGLEFEDLTIEDLYFIDDRTMNCSECGWWVETYYMDEEEGDICEDCAEGRLGLYD